VFSVRSVSYQGLDETDVYFFRLEWAVVRTLLLSKRRPHFNTKILERRNMW
jgi:hypothetical protein